MPSALHRPPMPRNPADASGRLRREQAAHAATRRELAAVRRQLESSIAERTAELELVKGRFEAALHGAKVCVFSQDRDLRYIWISGPFGGIAPEAIVGHTDDEILPALDHRAAAVAKREALETGVPAESEMAHEFVDGRALFSLHIEPTFAPDGSVDGIVCAAVEITDRKESEAHLRLLMREITHRSKNLLAVIQAMARQTARHSGSIGGFLDRFGARLQALAQSHDLLVQQSWHGALLHDVVRGQLRHYCDSGQITIDGPRVWLRPEAAQSLGLAVHELATNAVKHGSLSVPAGKVSVVWRRLDGGGIEILWAESGGPIVRAVRHRGFGSLVIEKNLVRALDAEVKLDFRPHGLVCRIVVPAPQLTEPGRQEHFAAALR